MSGIDRNRLRTVLEGTPLVAVERSHGQRGVERFRELAVAIMKMFHHVDPDGFPGVIVIFKCLDDAVRPLPEQEASVIYDVATFSQEVEGNVAVQVLTDGRFLLWKGLDVDVSTIAGVAVVYQYRAQSEQFFAGNLQSEVAKVGQYASIYAIPAFSDLREALERYRVDMARETSCPILKGAWADPNRLFFVNGPEDIMRDSLVHYLKVTLRDAETRPEQPMDVTHPTDVKVTFNFSPRLGVIEIKWVGASINKRGRILRYHDSRARQGARRLVDYLNWNKEQAPRHITRGYLVVFDGRRYRLRKDTKEISAAQARYYRNRELKFQPRFHRSRGDFERPVRMFMEAVYAA